MVGSTHGLGGAPTANQQVLIDGFVRLAVLLAAVVVMAVVIVLVRRYFRRRVQSDRAAFTLDQLKRLRDRGDLTEAEYGILRSKAMLDS